MIWQPTSSTRTDTLFPLTTLFRSYDGLSRFVCKLYNVVFLHCMQRWVNIMYAAVDNRGIDMQPVRDHNLGWVWFFMLFMILGAYLMMDLFVGGVVESFNTMRWQASGNTLLTKKQRSEEHTSDSSH